MTHDYLVYPLRSGDAFVCHWSGSSLVQVMACRLFGAKPFTWTNGAILSIGHLGTNFGEFYLKFKHFRWIKMHSKMSSAKWRPFCLGLDVVSPFFVNKQGCRICCWFLLQDVRIRPLAGYGLLHARQEGIRLQRLRVLIRQTLAYFIFIWAVVIVAYTSRPSQGAAHVRLSRQMFLAPSEPSKVHFQKVSQ